VIARAFVPERPLDQHEVGRRAPRHELPGRRHADEEPAARGEELLGDEHRKRRAHSAADQTQLEAVALDAIELGVVARPSRIAARDAPGDQAAHEVAVGIERADRRDGGWRQRLLAPGFTQQAFWHEDGGFRVTLLT
jgi:hypothetical protein